MFFMIIATIDILEDELLLLLLSAKRELREQQMLLNGSKRIEFHSYSNDTRFFTLESTN